MPTRMCAGVGLMVVGAAVLAPATASTAAAQQGPPPRRPGHDDKIKSMGFPPTWKPYTSLTADWDRREGSASLAGSFSLGIFKDLMNPEVGLLGLALEGYVRPNQAALDGGARLFAAMPVLHTRLGADYSVRDKRVDFIFSLDLPMRRSGILGRGTKVRLDWIPARSNYLSLGIEVPLGQPYLGRTRPRRDSVKLERGRRRRDAPPATAPELTEALRDLRHAADWVNRLTTPFFDLERTDDAMELDEFTAKVQQVKSHMSVQQPRYENGHTFAAEIAAYHESLERAFALAAAVSLQPAGEALSGRVIADAARTILLEEVIVPYNRLLGQRKDPDTVLGFAVAAEASLASWLAARSLDAGARSTAAGVFRTLIEAVESNRQGSRNVWGDSRYVWIPLRYGLRDEQVDARMELDGVIELVTRHRFTEGNDAHYVINEQFQPELRRTILEARDYHVLWIHDYRGFTGDHVDRIGAAISISYLEALTAAVDRYASTGTLPVFLLFLDQHYYEIRNSRLWLEMLRDPLHEDVELPEDAEETQRLVDAAVRNLRQAVQRATALQAAADRLGQDWLRNRVGVHVNITNPSDFSFRSRHVIPKVPFIPDNLMRDHRKIVFYDVTEADPNKGEAMYTGVGVGEQYVGATWDDRAILADGPALVDLKTEARELLLSQGFKPDQIPVPLRAQPYPASYEKMIAERIEDRQIDRAMQLHNETGFARKDANLVKAVLYELMPAGSVYVLPDSLWNSPLWAGMVSGAALRGCKVFPVAPSKDNAPSAADVTLSRINEVFTRFLVMSEEMSDEIADAGGLLRIGVYDMDVDASDVGAIVQRAGAREQPPFLRESLPMHPSVGEVFSSVPELLEREGIERVPLVEHDAAVQPKLHMKVHLFLSPAAIENLLPQADWAPIVGSYLVERARQTAIQREYVPARELSNALEQDTLALVYRWLLTVPLAELQQSMVYLTVGSHNQDYRSTMMDGEALYVITGVGSFIGYLDMAVLLVSTTWVDTLAQLRELLPEYEGLWKQMGRWIQNAL